MLKVNNIVAVSRATDFNSVVPLYFKVIGYKYVLWMVCGFTKFIKGAVLNSKMPESMIKNLHGLLCMGIGFPMVG